ncbi:MAG: hypothetical protein ABSE21_19730 [Bryobacteraceae bacterium]
MQNSNLGLTAPMRSISAHGALGLRLHSTAAVLVLLIAGPAGLTARQQPTQPQPTQQQQPAQPQQQQPKPRTFDPYYYPGRPALARSAAPPVAGQSKKTTATGKPTTPAKAAPSKQPAKTKRTAPSSHTPVAHQSATARQPVATRKASAKTVHSKKTADAAPNPDAQGKFGSGVGSYRSCLKGDNSPDGTVTEGFRKIVTPTAVGPSCHWEKVE